MLLVAATVIVAVVPFLVSGISAFDLCARENSTELAWYLAKNFTAKACGCSRSECIRKCCKPGFYLSGKFCVRGDPGRSFRIPLHERRTVAVGETDLSDGVLVGLPRCTFFELNVSNPADRVYLQRDGRLWAPLYRQFYDNDRYCVDEGGEGFAGFLCFPDEDRIGREFNVVGMIISMPFLLVTFLVYAVLPDSNLHRKALMFYVLTLLLSYIFLVTIQLYEGQFEGKPCQTLGYLVVFFFLASFFWMNVMCIDIWLAFNGIRGFSGKRRSHRKRFLFYCLYAWGMPILHVVVVLLLNEFGDPDKTYYPAVGKSKCFLGDGMPNLLYFYGPMAIINAINIILFILTAVRIQKVKKETSMLKQSDSKRHSYEDDKQKFNLYLKLLFAMGINWTMEIISWVCMWKTNNKVPPYVWYLTDFCNAMYGVFIFFIFVFKKKIWKSLQKRYYVFIGKPHLAHSLTTTQTTRSSNFSTTETGVAEHRLSELKNGRDERPLTQN